MPNFYTLTPIFRRLTTRKQTFCHVEKPHSPSGRGGALQPTRRQRLQGGVRREARGNPERIPLGGASRTEAEHHQP